MWSLACQINAMLHPQTKVLASDKSIYSTPSSIGGHIIKGNELDTPQLQLLQQQRVMSPVLWAPTLALKHH